MAKKKIEDFGEEIFGARKHLAQLNRELRATDIGDWTDAEREQNVTKNTASLWKHKTSPSTTEQTARQHGAK